MLHETRNLLINIHFHPLQKISCAIYSFLVKNLLYTKYCVIWHVAGQ